jgi:hypothetical protein
MREEIVRTGRATSAVNSTDTEVNSEAVVTAAYPWAADASSGLPSELTDPPVFHFAQALILDREDPHRSGYATRIESDETRSG